MGEKDLGRRKLDFATLGLGLFFLQIRGIRAHDFDKVAIGILKHQQANVLGQALRKSLRRFRVGLVSVFFRPCKDLINVFDKNSQVRESGDRMNKRLFNCTRGFLGIDLHQFEFGRRFFLAKGKDADRKRSTVG